MPSEYIRDPDKEFFEICRRAYPYFLHTDSDFLNSLIPLMRAIDIAYNDMNKANLYELVQRATDLLDGWDEGHKGVMTDLIRRHDFKVKSFDDRFAELYDLAKGKCGKKADKELSELKEKVEHLSIEVSKLKTLIAEAPAQILLPNPSIANLSITPSTQVQTINNAPKDIKKEQIKNQLEIIKERVDLSGEITVEECSKVLKITSYSARRRLKELIKENYIEMVDNKGRNIVYKKVKEKVPLEVPLVPLEVPVKEEVLKEAPMVAPEDIPKEAEKIKLQRRLSRNEVEQNLELIKNYLKTNREIDNSKCRELCNVNIKQANYLLHKLVKDNFIEQTGVSSGTKYIIKE